MRRRKAALNGCRRRTVAVVVVAVAVAVAVAADDRGGGVEGWHREETSGRNVGGRQGRRNVRRES